MIALAWLTGPVGRWAALAGLALAAAGSLYACGRTDGAARVENAAARATIEATESRDATDRVVGRARDPAGELRDEWSRD